jgi:hypothetical protein
MIDAAREHTLDRCQVHDALAIYRAPSRPMGALVDRTSWVYADEANTAWVRVSRIGKLMSAAAPASAISAYHIH